MSSFSSSFLKIFARKRDAVEESGGITDEDLLTPFVETVLFSVTTTCNLRCTYCAVSTADYVGETFDFSNIDEVAEGFMRARTHVVQISGHGETTAIPGWEKLCEAFYSRGIDLCITSNFSRPFSADAVDALARMKGITISIDTVDRELLKAIRRKVRLEDILGNMKAVRARALEIGTHPTFNWQCTLSDAVAFGLEDWMATGIEHGVEYFTLGNLFEHEGLPNGPKHVSKLGENGLLTAAAAIRKIGEIASDAHAGLIIQPGIIEAIDARLISLGHPAMSQAA